MKFEEAFYEVYTKFKMHFYQQTFKRIGSKKTDLTTVESFCMESIVALGKPTVAEFAKFMNISTPNAAYKVNNLVQKGYLDKIQSSKDRREYYLRTTEKYKSSDSISYSYLTEVMKRIRENFSPEDVEKLGSMLAEVAKELMPEMKIPHRI